MYRYIFSTNMNVNLFYTQIHFKFNQIVFKFTSVLIDTSKFYLLSTFLVMCVFVHKKQLGKQIFKKSINISIKICKLYYTIIFQNLINFPQFHFTCSKFKNNKYVPQIFIRHFSKVKTVVLVYILAETENVIIMWQYTYIEVN